MKTLNDTIEEKLKEFDTKMISSESNGGFCEVSNNKVVVKAQLIKEFLRTHLTSLAHEVAGVASIETERENMGHYGPGDNLRIQRNIGWNEARTQQSQQLREYLFTIHTPC